MNFSAIATPSVLGSASLLAFISVRSTSIAERIRSADREIVDSASAPERRKNLQLQVRGLRHRYLADTYGMLALLVAFAAFIAMDALAPISNGGAVSAFAVGIITGFAGFILTLYEVVTSPITLFADIAYAEAVTRNDAPPSDGANAGR